MAKKLLAIILICASFPVLAQTRPGSLRGTITEAASGETVPQANVVIYDEGGAIVKGGVTDFDGKYNLNPVPAGTYTVKVSFIGMATEVREGVLISPNAPTILDFKLKEATNELKEVVVGYQRPLIDKAKTTTVVDKEDISHMAVRDITSVASQAAGVTTDANGNTNIRGSRDEGTVYYIDGVKVRGNVSLPKAAIAQTEVITGGLPAQYGDAVGGVISTTTVGPSSQYFGSAEILTSSLFDHYDYNLGGLTIGGPIPGWKDKNGDPRLGFLISSEFQYNGEPRPAVVPYTHLDQNVLNSLQARPIAIDSSGTSYINRAELVTNKDLTDIKARPNSYNNQVRLNGSFQIKSSRNTTVTLGGRWDYNSGKSASYTGHIFNYDNNLDQMSSDWSAYAHFRQVFDNDPKSTIQNAFYDIQMDYSQDNNKTYYKKFGEDFFKYGYVGKFDIQRAPFFVYGTDSVTGTSGWLYINSADTNVVYTPGTENPVLSNYMSTYYDLAKDNPGINTSDFTVLQSSAAPPVNGQSPLSVYNNLWQNVGAPQSFNTLGVLTANYFKSQNAQFRITASTNFDLKDHSLIVGFEYEQRTDRAYALDATNLWTQGRLLQNKAISERDLEHPILVKDEYGVYQDTILYNRKYSENSASVFADNIRNELGLNRTDLVNIDNLDPSQLSIDMFSPDELINPGGTQYVGYYGYDYTGKLTNTNASIADFFTARDENGVLTRPIAAFRPIYMAGYVQDQFTFRDLTFNVGLRVERYDMNQSVLKDPYVLYPYYTVADLPSSAFANRLDEFKIPSNIGSDYAIYVSSYDYSTATIVGYRSGDQFYDATGAPLADPSVLSDAAGGGIKPFLTVTPDDRSGENQKNGGSVLIPAESFKDYEPQTVVMPRISFNFPITDEALFVAHYDILAQRPTPGASRLNPFDYLALANLNSSGLLNNPDLRPQKTTEYEIGFKQALNDNAALKISAFYRELRDLIQTVSFTEAYPLTYVAFGNKDFGTVKGFSLEYEMRRVHNFKLNANYTLQFADGTGSGATTGLNLARNGQPNLRYILPLSYDNRHQILVRADYRYGHGSNYNGPVWWNTKFLEDFGVNVTMNALSGRPYTKRNTPYVVTTTNPGAVALVEGQVNGSRLPWQVTFDAKINKVFSFKKKKEGATGYNSLEVYLQILNLFNTKNVTDVYAFTGSADDDGYLASEQAQTLLSSQTSAQSYLDLYNRRIIDPGNYALPRRIRLGISYSF